MKKVTKLLGVFLSAAFVALVASCSGNSKANNSDSTETSSANSDSKILVAYYSATGTTAKEAGKIADVTGGTLYEIQPVTPYTDADLDYENEQSRSTVEQKDSTSRPEIKTGLEIAPYETVYLGFPVWWYDAPRVIYTFLDSYDFSGKKIVVFATAHSSTLQSSFDALKKAYPQYNLVEGDIYNMSNKTGFDNWVESLKK